MQSAAQAAVVHSLEIYLKTTYRPDCDYIEGRIEERNVGEAEHAFLQGLLTHLLWQHASEWGIVVYPEQRVQISADRYRIPDIAVVSRNQPFETILTRPPLLCIEILSPEDRWPRITERLADYRRMGVPNLWALDPQSEKAWSWSADRAAEDWQETLQLTVSGGSILIDASYLFAQLAAHRQAGSTGESLH